MDEDGIVLDGGLIARWAEVIEVRDGVVYIAAHRPALEERAEEGT